MFAVKSAGDGPPALEPGLAVRPFAPSAPSFLGAAALGSGLSPTCALASSSVIAPDSTSSRARSFMRSFFPSFFFPVALAGVSAASAMTREPTHRGKLWRAGMGRGVELVRVEREERTFDREEVLGRDTASVFPSLEGGGGAGEGGASEEAKKMASKFVTESELEAIQSSGDGPDSARGDDPSSSKPLYQILAERKEMKELEFEENWQSMKVEEQTSGCRGG